MDCSVDDGHECSSKYFAYGARCSSSECKVYACRLAGGWNKCYGSDYEFEMIKRKADNVWEGTCYYYEAEYICKGLEALGYRSACC